MSWKWSAPSILGLIATLLVSTALQADHLRNVPVGNPLPSFNMDGLDGKNVSSEQTAGKVVVLVYVSAKQRQSEEILAGARRAINSMANADVKLVFMSSDVNEAAYFRELRDRLMVHEPFALDAKRTYYGQLGLIAFPTTVVTGKNGKLLHVIAISSRNYEHQLNLYCRHALGEFDDAELAKRLAAKPVNKNEVRDKAERHRSTATVLRKKGMTDSAVQELEQAVAIDPTFAEASIELSEILVASGKLDEAEKRMNALLAKQPQFHRAKLTLGLIKLKRGLLPEAEKMLAESLVMNPDPVRAHYYLGQLYEKKSDYKSAMSHYRDALKGCLNER